MPLAFACLFFFFSISTHSFHFPRMHARIALVLVAVVCLTCVLSYYQEGQSAKVMNSFKVRPLAQWTTHPPTHPPTIRSTDKHPFPLCCDRT